MGFWVGGGQMGLWEGEGLNSAPLCPEEGGKASTGVTEPAVGMFFSRSAASHLLALLPSLWPG